MRIKKIIGFFLALSFVLSAFGCGYKESDKPTETVKDTETAEETDAETKEDGMLTPYGETIVLKQAKFIRERTTYINGENYAENFITDFYREKLNIDWQIEWVCDEEDYSTKVGMAIACGEYPDVMCVNRWQLQHLAGSEYILDLTDIYEEYASPLLKENIEYEDKSALKTAMNNGRIYGIPLTTTYESNAALMWIREDWRKAIGCEAPKTLDELKNYLDLLKEYGFVKGTGSGMDFYGPGSASFDAIAEMFNAYYNIWVENEDGELVYSSFEPEMRDALLGMQEMYKEGYIKRTFAIDGTPILTRIADGDIGVFFGEFFYPHLLKTSVLEDENADWSAYPIPVNKDGECIPKKSEFVESYTVISSSCAHPEAVLKSMNLWAEIWFEGGIYRDWYTEKITGEYKKIIGCGDYALPYFFEGVTNCATIGRDIRYILENNSSEEALKKYPYALITYSYISLSEPDDYFSGEGWALEKVYTSAMKVFDENYSRFATNRFQGMLSDEMIYYANIWVTLTTETFISIIMGEPIEAFDTLATRWKNEGKEITAAVNEWYRINQPNR